MKADTLLKMSLASLIFFALANANSHKKEMSEIYEKSCAHCHGANADGVPKAKESHAVEADEAKSKGLYSEQKVNIHGSSLKHLSQEELTKRIAALRDRSFESTSYHSVMQKNLKTIENREGKLYDEKMAQYIYETYGRGSN